MFKIRKEFAFCAMHRLENLPPEHPCSRVHGHNYVITIELGSQTLNETGFILDYRKLDPIKKWLDETLDHRSLNDVCDYNPTAELMAWHFWHIFNDLLSFEASEHPFTLLAVEVSETPKTSSRYECEVPRS